MSGKPYKYQSEEKTICFKSKPHKYVNYKEIKMGRAKSLQRKFYCMKDSVGRNGLNVIMAFYHTM